MGLLAERQTLTELAELAETHHELHTCIVCERSARGPRWESKIAQIWRPEDWRPGRPVFEIAHPVTTACRPCKKIHPPQELEPKILRSLKKEIRGCLVTNLIVISDFG